MAKASELGSCQIQLNLCHSRGYEQLQKSIGLLKASFENVNFHIWILVTRKPDFVACKQPKCGQDCPQSDQLLLYIHSLETIIVQGSYRQVKVNSRTS